MNEPCPNQGHGCEACRQASQDALRGLVLLLRDSRVEAVIFCVLSWLWVFLLKGGAQ